MAAPHSPARAEAVADAQAVRDWLREPDYADSFNLDEVIEWINRRPISAFERIAKPAPAPSPAEALPSQTSRAEAWYPGPKERLSRHADIIVEAINEYDGWLRDDDYDARGCLDRIMARMRERYELAPEPSLAKPASEPAGGGVDFLKQLRAANIARNEEYRAKTGGQPLPLLFRTTEFAGEVGELLNVVKKIERERLGWSGKRANREDMIGEFGGVGATFDLLAMELDVDLAEAIASEFNSVSDRLGLTTKLSLSSPASSSPAEAEGLQAGVEAWRPNERALEAACEAVLAVPDHPGDKKKIRDAITAYIRVASKEIPR